MREHRHDEFSVTMRWKQPESGSYPRVSAPGFYVTAGWTNEGYANYPINNLRLGNLSFLAIMDVLDDVGQCAGTFAAAGQRVLWQSNDALAARRAALKAQIEKAQATLAEMDE